MESGTPEQITFPIGTVLKGHGLKGEVIIHPLFDNVENLHNVHAVIAAFPNGRIEDLELEQVRTKSGKVVITFKGIEDRTSADALRGVVLSIAREHLPALEPGEFYLGELVGYEVVLDDEMMIGPVREVWDLPANEVLRVIRDGKEILIPLIEEVIREIDHNDRRIVITAMEGLLD